MGPFDKINQALGGKKPAPAPSKTRTGNADFSAQRATRDSIMRGETAASGSTTLGNGHTTSGLDQAMQQQADKLHPVGKPVVNPDMGEIQG